MKKVSIIIPCYNQGHYVKEAVESALSQTYMNIEIVCVNDGSTDNSAEVLENLAKKYKQIVFFNERENHGVVYARNMAIQAASGEYILPLDADDKIEPAYVEKAVKILEENPKIGIVYCEARFFGTQNGVWKLPEFNLDRMLYENTIFCCAMFRKTDFQKAGGYKEYMNHGYEDWDLWLSFVEQGLEVYRIDEILFNYRKYKEKSRSNRCKNHMTEIYKNILKHHANLFLTSDFFIKNIFKSSYKKLKKYKTLLICSLIVNIILLLAICIYAVYIIGAQII